MASDRRDLVLGAPSLCQATGSGLALVVLTLAITLKLKPTATTPQPLDPAIVTSHLQSITSDLALP
jgi:hypothetical protein